MSENLVKLWNLSCNVIWELSQILLMIVVIYLIGDLPWSEYLIYTVVVKIKVGNTAC